MTERVNNVDGLIGQTQQERCTDNKNGSDDNSDDDGFRIDDRGTVRSSDVYILTLLDRVANPNEWNEEGRLASSGLSLHARERVKPVCSKHNGENF
jgi:hypothetical protein